MTSTLIGYFDSFEEAKQTENDLLSSGFAEEQVDLITEAPEWRGRTRTEPASFWQSMKELFGLKRPEARTGYEEAARHGTIVAVRAPDERVDLAAEIIERHHPADLDRKMEEWGTREEAEAQEMPREEGETIPIVEEQAMIGKEVVKRGAVRIHQYVTTKAVEAEIPLREEEIDVQRRRVDRPVEATEEAFREREISVEAMGEEPVVTKEARVVEEVDVGTKATERVEKVREEVKKTEVEIEPEKQEPSER